MLLTLLFAFPCHDPVVTMASPSQSSSSHQQSSLPRLLQVTAGGNIRGGRNQFSFNFFQESCHFLSCLFRKCYFLLLICFHFLFLNSYPSFCFKHYKTKYSWIFHLCRNQSERLLGFGQKDHGVRNSIQNQVQNGDKYLEEIQHYKKLFRLAQIQLTVTMTIRTFCNCSEF